MATLNIAYLRWDQNQIISAAPPMAAINPATPSPVSLASGAPKPLLALCATLVVVGGVDVAVSEALLVVVIGHPTPD